MQMHFWKCICIWILVTICFHIIPVLAISFGLTVLGIVLDVTTVTKGAWPWGMVNWKRLRFFYIKLNYCAQIKAHKCCSGATCARIKYRNPEIVSHQTQNVHALAGQLWWRIRGRFWWAGQDQSLGPISTFTFSHLADALIQSDLH